MSGGPTSLRPSVFELEADAREQERNFVNGAPSSDAAGVELFRRAIDEHDELAWAAVVDLYRGLLLAQAARVVVRGLVHEDDQFCVERAFERFWHATRRAGLAQFPDLASILKYLKLCLGSVLLDEARARRRQAALPIDAVAPDASVSDDPTAAVPADELWRAVQSELKTAHEGLVARLSFVDGLTPRQIAARCPREFDSIGDIYRIKRNIIERLRHSAAIQAFR